MSALRHTAHHTPRRAFLSASIGLALLGAARANAQSAGFPDRPVKIVVPFGAGGLADVTFRIVAEKLSGLLGKQVVIENIPGAGGIAAGSAVLRAKPDGHTLLVIANGTAITKSLFKTMPFDIQKDIVPVSLAAYFDLVIVVKGERALPYAWRLAGGRARQPGQAQLRHHHAGQLTKPVSRIIQNDRQPECIGDSVQDHAGYRHRCYRRRNRCRLRILCGVEILD